jgi:hypothetical protein
MRPGATEVEDALKKELAETKDQVKVLKERTTAVQESRRPLLLKVFVVVVLRV